MDNSLQAQPSSPSPKLVEASRQLPSLPTEILQRIIQLALPRLSFTTFKERYGILLPCCRVNKLWAALAQKELYRHVAIDRNVETRERLEGSLQAVERGQGLQSLRIAVEHESTVTASGLCKLLSQCPGLRGFHITSFHDQTAPVDLVQLAMAAPGELNARRAPLSSLALLTIL
jgi:hypothetical protein